MLNSPLLPSTPCCRTVDGMGGIYLAEATTVSYFQQTFVWQPSIRPSFYPCVQQIKNFVNQKFSSVEGIFEKKTSPEVRYVEYLVGVQLRYLSIYCLRKRILYFQNMPLGGAFFEACQCFIPRREIRSISSIGPIDTLSIYCLRKRIFDFQNMPLGEAFFEPCQCFIWWGGPRQENQKTEIRKAKERKIKRKKKENKEMPFQLELYAPNLPGIQPRRRFFF